MNIDKYFHEDYVGETSHCRYIATCHFNALFMQKQHIPFFYPAEFKYTSLVNSVPLLNLLLKFELRLELHLHIAFRCVARYFTFEVRAGLSLRKFNEIVMLLLSSFVQRFGFPNPLLWVCEESEPEAKELHLHPKSAYRKISTVC